MARRNTERQNVPVLYDEEYQGGISAVPLVIGMETPYVTSKMSWLRSRNGRLFEARETWHIGCD